MERSRTKSSDRRLSHLDFTLLGGFGTLVAHEIAYVPSAFSRAPVAHGHLPLLWAVVSPLALWTVGSFIVRSLRSRPGRRTVSARQLGSAMAGIFVVMEVVERLANGLPVESLASEGVVWACLAIIPIVAVVLSRLISTAAKAVAAWIATPARPSFIPLPSKPLFDQVSGFDLGQVFSLSQSRRGPPIRIVH